MNPYIILPSNLNAKIIIRAETDGPKQCSDKGGLFDSRITNGLKMKIRLVCSVDILNQSEYDGNQYERSIVAMTAKDSFWSVYQPSWVFEKRPEWKVRGSWYWSFKKDQVDHEKF